jgi:imidazolonepropionase-like amidohydrolase
MKPGMKPGATPAVALLAAAAILLASPRGNAETVAIVHARAWTMLAAEPLDNATLVLADGKIASVAAGAQPPVGARVIDARGRNVTPGLMHAATQLGLIEVSAATETNDSSVATGTLGAAFDVQYAINPNSESIALARSDGVTRAVTFPGSSAVAPWSGTAVLLRLHEPQALIEGVGTAIVVSIGNRTSKSAGGSRAAQWQLLREALTEAKQAVPQSNATAETRSADVRALEPVLAGRTPLVISTQRESDLRQAIQLTKDFGLRIILHGAAEGWRIARELATAKIPVIVDPEVNLPMSFDQMAVRNDNAARLQAAGVTIACIVSGNGIYLSYNAGSSLREGAGIAVANGMPYIEALRSITQGPARIWRVDERFGALAPGKDADIVIWSSDPLEPATQPEVVLVAGQEISLRTRQTELSERYLRRAEAAPGR